MADQLALGGAPMDRAVEIAKLGPAHGPNPRVGCVIVRPDASSPTGYELIAEGHHEGAGTPHAEAAALAQAAQAGLDVRGAIAYVSLEPCNHTGRTGPCAPALADAGIGRVIYAVPDPNPTAAGGAGYLVKRGITVEFAPHDEAEAINRRWLKAMAMQRPYVIAKWAATLDGRVAAADGTSFWITGEEAREHVHRVRTEVDAILVGTGTVVADDPQLSARPGGVEGDYQPLRIVIGERDTSGAKVWRDRNAKRVDSRDPSVGLLEAWRSECRVVLIEGGATLTSAFVRAGLVDEINAYIAPALLGDGPTAVSDLGIATMAGALRGTDVTVTRLGADTLITALL